MTRRHPIVVLAFVATISCEAPGEGPKAKRGFQRAAPVIEALGKYQTAQEAYPESLGSLVPRYLHASALAVPDREQERYPLEYQALESGRSFTIGFRYVGPGMNTCEYRSVVAKWSCSGHF